MLNKINKKTSRHWWTLKTSELILQAAPDIDGLCTYGELISNYSSEPTITDHNEQVKTETSTLTSHVMISGILNFNPIINKAKKSKEKLRNKQL